MAILYFHGDYRLAQKQCLAIAHTVDFLVLLQDPKYFLLLQIFEARPKIELNFSAPPKSFVLAQKLNLLYENHLLVWHKKFGTGTICKSFFGMQKKFEPAQNVWDP